MLAESFTRDDTLISVVGTLSPAAADTEHSISTLKTICQLAGDEKSIGESSVGGRFFLPRRRGVRVAGEGAVSEAAGGTMG